MEPSADLLTKWQGWQQGTHSLAQAVSNTPHPSASEARAGGSVRTFSSGSAYSRNQDTTACPLSCVATTRRSSLLMTCTQRRRRGRERRTRGCLYKSRCCSLQAAHVPAYLSHTAPKAAPSCRFKTDDRNLLAAAPGPAACCLGEREVFLLCPHIFPSLPSSRVWESVASMHARRGNIPTITPALLLCCNACRQCLCSFGPTQRGGPTSWGARSRGTRLQQKTPPLELARPSMANEQSATDAWRAQFLVGASGPFACLPSLTPHMQCAVPDLHLPP